MARNKKNEPREAPRAAADYYRLNVKAVDDLVEANEANSPPVPEAELRKYRPHGRVRMAGWLKAVLLKAWFAGMVCFFFLWGLGTYVASQLDLLLIVGLALGFVTDLLVNPLFRFLAQTPGDNDRWMMVPRKCFSSLPLNVLYGLLLLFCVVMTYNALNAAILSVTHAKDTVPVGVEPLLFGAFTMGWDMLFLGIRRMLRRMIADAKKSAGQ